MDPVTYKEYHESFMRNNNGSTIEDVFLTVIPTFFTTFLATNIIYVAHPLGVIPTFVIEFILIVASTVLHVTILNYRIWEISLTLLCVTITAAVKQIYGRIHIAPFVQVPCQRPEYLNLFRAAINLLTAVCILAVDFKCFPRKLAKTETFGFGLMDTGVGFYVFGNGLVAPELSKASESSRLTWKKLEKTIIGCLPLVVLGAVRFAATNELDYQQHISEYGVHWNFFLTLAFTKFFGSILLGILPHFEYLKYLSMVLLFAHELFLQLGAADYIIDPNNQIKRDSFQNANREGIFSIPGYVSLYLASVYIGYRLRKEESVPEKNKNDIVFTNIRQLFWKTVRLFFVALILWKITYILKNMFGVSRRMANMGYVFWMLSIGTTVVVCFMLLEIFYYFRSFDRRNVDDGEKESSEKRNYAPIILNGITYNGLVFFLLANLMTGIVNLCFQTLLLNTAQALVILFVYMFALCSISTFLYLKKIKLKAW
ncbi:uncharacterized protein LOC129566924 [Sitodiplosis mosellana]|uniref:uncharacterized protein LOC129566924 n=1 Tax=Sitodiplosis mosellana TaxID=263140 RepID=UPI002443993F|nr:uncharacterized protein LOC129566924 [Sitodiplosis mosellana]